MDSNRKLVQESPSTNRENSKTVLGKVAKIQSRWTNQLNPLIKCQKWSKEEIEILLKIHNEVGNKWAIISKSLPGRTNNAIKNFFMNSLKKGMNTVNGQIKAEKTFWKIKPFKMSILNKLYLIMDEKTHERINVLENSAFESAKRTKFNHSDIKGKLIKISERLQKLQSQSMQELIKQINNFDQTCQKKKIKKKKALNQSRKLAAHKETPIKMQEVDPLETEEKFFLQSIGRIKVEEQREIPEFLQEDSPFNQLEGNFFESQFLLKNKEEEIEVKKEESIHEFIDVQNGKTSQKYPQLQQAKLQP